MGPLQWSAASLLLTRRRVCACVCVCAHTCERVFGKFAYSHTDDVMFFSARICVCGWCAWIVVGNIVMNFCCWFIYYYDDDDDCDSMERPFRNWIEWRRRWQQQHQQKSESIEEISSNIVYLLLHILSIIHRRCRSAAIPSQWFPFH